MDTALAHAQARVRAGLVDPEQDFHPEHAHLGPRDALAALQRLRPRVAAHDLVVCQGDSVCGTSWSVRPAVVSGPGGLGVADRWWDLAVATWSLTWNLGSGWEDGQVTLQQVHCAARTRTPNPLI